MPRGSVAQLVERTTENREVTGSTPVGATRVIITSPQKPSPSFYMAGVLLCPGEGRFSRWRIWLIPRALSERSESTRLRRMPIRWPRRRLGPVWGRLALRYGADMDASSLTVRQLADELDVDPKAVRAWMRRQSWRHPVEPHRRVRSALPTVAAIGRQGSRHDPSAAGPRGRRTVRTFFTRSRPT